MTYEKEIARLESGRDVIWGRHGYKSEIIY